FAENDGGRSTGVAKVDRVVAAVVGHCDRAAGIEHIGVISQPAVKAHLFGFRLVEKGVIPTQADKCLGQFQVRGVCRIEDVVRGGAEYGLDGAEDIDLPGPRNIQLDDCAAVAAERDGRAAGDPAQVDGVVTAVVNHGNGASGVEVVVVIAHAP